MKSNFRKPKSMPRTQPQTYISSWVWMIFIGGVLLFVSSAFVSTWTSTGPTFLSVQESFAKQNNNN